MTDNNNISTWFDLHQRYIDFTNQLTHRLKSEGVVSLLYNDEIILDTSYKNNNKRMLDCMICCEEERNCLIMPCGHLVFCLNCFLKYWENNNYCPLCRVFIDDYKEIFT